MSAFDDDRGGCPRDPGAGAVEIGSVDRDLGALSPWAPELARTFVSLASDIALVIDDVGVIRNVVQGHGDPLTADAHDWVGRPWIDTVSGDTRPKIVNLLKEVATTGIGRRREVNHRARIETDAHSQGHADIPVAYTAIRLGRGGPVLAVGRDLRAVAAIQQRYVDSQQEMERSYWKARQAEARYELLFQVATDAVVVVDAESFQIIEANQPALQLYQGPDGVVQGLPATFAFAHRSRSAINELLAEARRSGRSSEIRARLQGSHTSASVVAMSFRALDSTRLLVRVRTLDAAQPSPSLTNTLARLVDPSRDGVVVTDSSGTVRIANPAFLSLAGMAPGTDIVGQPLMSWLKLKDQPLSTLISRVGHDGIARQIASSIAHPGGVLQPVEVTAALLAEGDQECIGFTIRSFGVPTVVDAAALPSATAGVDVLSEALRSRIALLGDQMGDRPVPDLMIEATALVERYFAEIARGRQETPPC